MTVRRMPKRSRGYGTESCSAPRTLTHEQIKKTNKDRSVRSASPRPLVSGRSTQVDALLIESTQWNILPRTYPANQRRLSQTQPKTEPAVSLFKTASPTLETTSALRHTSRAPSGYHIRLPKKTDATPWLLRVSQPSEGFRQGVASKVRLQTETCPN